MPEIRPWLETGDAPVHLRDLLCEAEMSRPLDARTRARSRRRLVAISALPVAAGVVFWVKNIALGAVLGGAVVVVAYAPKFHQSAAKPDATAIQSAPRATHMHRSALAARDTSVDGGVTVLPSVPLAAPGRSSTAATPSAQPSQLSRETRLLERARELMSYDARQALVSLGAHQREFPHGALELERDLLAVQALLKLGQRQQAQLRAAQLRAQAPGSIYEQRLTRLLGEEPDQQP